MLTTVEVVRDVVREVVRVVRDDVDFVDDFTVVVVEVGVFVVSLLDNRVVSFLVVRAGAARAGCNKCPRARSKRIVATEEKDPRREDARACCFGGARFHCAPPDRLSSYPLDND